MPSIKDQSTVEAIARTYCGEAKRNKTETLKIVGYKPSYYLGGQSSEVVWGNKRVIAEIARIDGVNAANSTMTVERVQGMYEEARQLAIANNQPSAAVSAVTGIARLYGMDKDSQTDTAQVDEMDKAEADAVSKEAIKDLYQDQGPQLSKANIA